jgi:hypothetical protein
MAVIVTSLYHWLSAIAKSHNSNHACFNHFHKFSIEITDTSAILLKYYVQIPYADIANCEAHIRDTQTKNIYDLNTTRKLILHHSVTLLRR